MSDSSIELKTVKVLNGIHERLVEITDERGGTLFDTIDDILEKNLPAFEAGNPVEATIRKPRVQVTRNSSTTRSAQIRKGFHRRISKIAGDTRRKFYRVTEDILEAGLRPHESRSRSKVKGNGLSNHAAVR